MRIPALSNRFSRPLALLCIGGTLSIFGAVPGVAQDDAMQHPLTATLTGAAETGGGDTDGTGSFSASIDMEGGQICYVLTVSDIAAASAAHIHRGPVGENGPPVVTLTAPTEGMSDACVNVEPELLMELSDHPEEFYVNVHNAEFSAGAVRGQLTIVMDAGYRIR